ncbi:MAG: prepilin-type N-terminal cleavage/methylation domain-containing protein [candidate division NC10 bacterium]
MTRQDFNRARGFSLLEVLVAMAVFSIVLFAIYTTFESSMGTYAKGDLKTDIHQNARGAMELMVRDIRLAGFFPEDFSPTPIPPAAEPPGCVGPPFTGISTATFTQITICGDVDGDDSSELVTYTWFGDTSGDTIIDPGENEIQRQVTEVVGADVRTEVVAVYISAFQFSYFDRLNNLINPAPGACAANTAPPCDIGRVVVSMTGSQPQQQSAPIGGRTPSAFATRVLNYRLVTDVLPRNLL